MTRLAWHLLRLRPRFVPCAGTTRAGVAVLIAAAFLLPEPRALAQAGGASDALYVQFVRVHCQQPAGSAYVGDNIQIRADGRVVASGRGLGHGESVDLLRRTAPVPFRSPQMDVDLVVTSAPNGPQRVARQSLFRSALPTYRRGQEQAGELIGLYQGIGARYQVSVHVGTRSELAQLRSRLLGPPPKPRSDPQPRVDPMEDAMARQARARVAGARLHIHTPPSPFALAPSMPRASQSSTIDFCADGRFIDSGTTSMSAPGALAGGSRTASGRWSIGRRDGAAVLALRYADTGNVATYPLASVTSGSWRAGRTRYAMEEQGAECP